MLESADLHEFSMCSWIFLVQLLDASEETLTAVAGMFYCKAKGNFFTCVPYSMCQLSVRHVLRSSQFGNMPFYVILSGH